METEELVSKLIELHEKANVHSSQYQKLQNMPGNRSKASLHYRKAQRLQSRIQGLIHKIASPAGGLDRAFANDEAETP